MAAEDELLGALETFRAGKAYHFSALLVTDVATQSSLLLVVGIRESARVNSAIVFLKVAVVLLIFTWGRDLPGAVVAQIVSAGQAGNGNAPPAG